MLLIDTCFLFFLFATVTEPVRGQCGQSFYQPQFETFRTRIINGNTAKPHSWPWTVWVRYNYNGQNYHCGGSLLGLANTPNQSDIVVTAAHCVIGSENKPVDPRGFAIHIGNHDVKKQEIAEVQIGVSKYVWHSLYTPYTHDIALLKLTAPVKFNNYIQPICLPAQSILPSDTTNCYVTGWGRTDNFKDDSAAQLMQQTRLPIVSDTTCGQAYSGIFNSRTMLCAGFLDGSRAACNGDSGGPLVCPHNKRWTLFGAVSFGHKGTCATANKPNVFTRISNYRTWIDVHVANLAK